MGCKEVFVTRSCFRDVLERFDIMTDTQATDVVTYDFKGTGVRCVVCRSIDYQINFFLEHNVAK